MPEEIKQTLLVFLVQQDRLELVLLMQNQGIYSQKAFDAAMELGKFAIAERLLSSFHDKLQITNNHLEIAVKKNNEALTQCLLCAGTIEPFPDVLQYAIEGGNQNIVSLLILYGYEHPEALSHAIKSHNLQIFEYLLSQGTWKDNAYMTAVENNELPMLRLLLQKNGI